MTRLEVPFSPTRTEVILRSSPHWTAVIFFAALAALHGYVATTSFLTQRWEAFMSVIFCVAFALVALGCWLVRTELHVCTAERQIRRRTGLGRFAYVRLTAFSKVRGVRLTLIHPNNPMSAQIELLCDGDVIVCPPTRVPRQEALCLALTLGTRLIKVYGAGFDDVAHRIDELPWV